MLINRLRPEYLELLENAKKHYPISCELIVDNLSVHEYVSGISYGVFSEMRLIFGDRYSAYDYFFH